MFLLAMVLEDLGTGLVYGIEVRLIEVLALLTFGNYSIATRYKSRVLAYMMMSLGYCVSLLMKAGLEDLCFDISSGCQIAPIYLRVLRLLLITCWISHTVIAYYNRDSMLLSHNYFYSKNSSVLDLISEAETEEINKTFYIIHSFPLCPDCNEIFLTYHSIKLVCIRPESCSACYDKLETKTEISLIENWIDTYINEVKNPSIN